MSAPVRAFRSVRSWPGALPSVPWAPSALGHYHRPVAGGTGSGSWASSPANLKSMQGNRSRDTKPELAVRSRGATAMHAVPGGGSATAGAHHARADLVLRTSRVAVVRGSAATGTAAPSTTPSPPPTPSIGPTSSPATWPGTPRPPTIWRGAGWTVLRFWEHEDPEAVADRVQQTVRAALQSPEPGPAHPHAGS